MTATSEEPYEETPEEIERFWKDAEALGTVRWFGMSWQAPVCTPRTKVRTPVGFHCSYCERVFERTDQGIRLPHMGTPEHPPNKHFSYYHRTCWMETVLGPSWRGFTGEGGR